MTERACFTVYVHLPYCVRKCPYCDFNSHALGTKGIGSLEGGYIEAVVAELRACAPNFLVRSPECASVFFGGGTPSLFSPESIFKAAVDIH